MGNFVRNLAGICLGIFTLVSAVSAQTAAPVLPEVDFDALFEWKKPCALTSEDLEAKVAALETVPGRKLYVLDAVSNAPPSQLFNPGNHKTRSVKCLIFGNKTFEPDSVRVMWASGQLDYLGITYPAQEEVGEAPPSLLASIGDALGAPPFSRNGKSYMWVGEHFNATAWFLSREDKVLFVSIRPKKTSASPLVDKPASPSAVAEQQKTVIDLDAFVDWKNPLDLTKVAFESIMKQHQTTPSQRPYAEYRDVHPNGDISNYFVIKSSLTPAYSIEMTMLGSQCKPVSFQVIWSEGRAKKVAVIFQRPSDQNAQPKEIVAALDDLFGFNAEKRSDAFYEWTSQRFMASYTCYIGDSPLRLEFNLPAAPMAVVTPPATKPPAPAPAAQGTEIVINLDDFIDWKTPVNLSVETFDAKLRTLENEAGSSLCRQEHRPDEELRFFDPRHVRGAKVKYPILDGQYYLTYAFMHWKQGKLITIELAGMKMAGGQEIEPLQTMYKLDKMFGVSHLVEADYAYSWSPPAIRALLIRNPTVGYIFRLEQPREQPVATVPATPRPVRPPDGTQGLTPASALGPLAANLDALLNFSSFWTWTADDFEKTYIPKTAKQEDQKKPQQFEWLSSSKERARFSRHMESKEETKLSMFGGSIKLEEAVLVREWQSGTRHHLLLQSR